MLEIGEEGQVRFYYYKGKISSSLPVFYNPIMVVNRDITNFFLNELKIKKAVSLMSGTGVREIRWKKELNIKEVVANDINPRAIELIKKNAELNEVSLKITQKDARFYDEFTEFIDIDPFGSPLPFLQPIIKSKFIKITATDLAVFCTYKNKSLLKYKDFAKNKNYCHIEAIKILTKRVRDFLRMHELSADLIFAYYYKHHITIFLKKTKKWRKLGFSLSNKEFWENINIKKYEEYLKNKTIIASETSLKILKLLKKENSFKGKYYYLPYLYSKYKIKPKSIEKLILELNNVGIKASRTHFDPETIKTNAELETIIKMLKSIN